MKLPESANLGARLGETRLNGDVIIGELVRNMELGRFEMTYTVLFPCVFTVYLNPEDYAALSGIFHLIIDDARRTLRSRVGQLNEIPTVLASVSARKAGRSIKSPAAIGISNSCRIPKSP